MNLQLSVTHFRCLRQWNVRGHTRILFGFLLAFCVGNHSQGDESVVHSALERVRSHDFHPLNEDHTFTLDRTLDTHGIADLENRDGRVRLLAIRDLVRAGIDSAGGIAKGLEDPNLHVRQVCAAALGVLRAQQATDPLEELAQKDPTSLVRTQAVISLGQMVSQGSLELLREIQRHDPSRDVKHQCELAIDQIEKQMGATDELQAAYRQLNEGQFTSLKVGQSAPEFTLPDTSNQKWNLQQLRGDNDWVVLLWIFADWCPVCHGEFQELIDMKKQFKEANVQVVTLECHDLYRCRVMVGKELEPDYWFAEKSFKESYTQEIWWPHLMDRAGAIGASYGVEPMAFAVHSEYINRPATIIIDPAGKVRFAYYGTFWGDRPSIEQTLDMINERRFEFQHPERLQSTSAGAAANSTP